MGTVCVCVCVVETRQRQGGQASERRGLLLKVREQGTEEEDRIRGREGERGSSISISGARS